MSFARYRAPTALLALVTVTAACGDSSPEHSGSTSESLAAAPPASLVGYWPLDDGSGLVAHDRSGQGHDMSLGNSSAPVPADPTWSTDGPSLSFNGSQLASTPLTPILEPAYVSIEAWVKATGSQGGNHYIVSKQYSSTCTLGQYALYSGQDGGLSFYVNNGFGLQFGPRGTSRPNLGWKNGITPPAPTTARSRTSISTAQRSARGTRS